MKRFYNHLVSIDSHEKLIMQKGKLCTENGESSYDIVLGIPIMLPKTVKAKWHRELIEIILWEHTDEIERIYKELGKTDNYAEIYTKHLKKIFSTKQEILEAFEKYSAEAADKWIAENYSETITGAQKREFLSLSLKRNGRKRTKTKINATGIFEIYPIFSKSVNINSPETILELGTGAGGGTAAIALQMTENTVLFTVDIGFSCLGNAVGIRKYQKKNIIPVCVNFWYLPFADESFDAVCTYNGLDESREIERTVEQVSRVLKKGGTFTVMSREKAYMRQGKVLEPFGFAHEEITEIMSKCRAYSDIDSLTILCRNYGLILKKQEKFDRGNNLISVLSQFVKE